MARKLWHETDIDMDNIDNEVHFEAIAAETNVFRPIEPVPTFTTAVNGQVKKVSTICLLNGVKLKKNSFESKTVPIIPIQINQVYDKKSQSWSSRLSPASKVQVIWDSIVPKSLGSADRVEKSRLSTDSELLSVKSDEGKSELKAPKAKKSMRSKQRRTDESQSKSHDSTNPSRKDADVGAVKSQSNETNIRVKSDMNAPKVKKSKPVEQSSFIPVKNARTKASHFEMEMENSDPPEEMLIESANDTIDIVESQSNELLDSPSRSASNDISVEESKSSESSPRDSDSGEEIQPFSMESEQSSEKMTMTHEVNAEQSDRNSAKMKIEHDEMEFNSNASETEKSIASEQSDDGAIADDEMMSSIDSNGEMSESEDLDEQSAQTDSKRHPVRTATEESQLKRHRTANPSNDLCQCGSYQKNYIRVKGNTVHLQIG